METPGPCGLSRQGTLSSLSSFGREVYISLISPAPPKLTPRTVPLAPTPSKNRTTPLVRHQPSPPGANVWQPPRQKTIQNPCLDNITGQNTIRQISRFPSFLEFSLETKQHEPPKRNQAIPTFYIFFVLLNFATTPPAGHRRTSLPPLQ